MPNTGLKLKSFPGTILIAGVLLLLLSSGAQPDTEVEPQISLDTVKTVLARVPVSKGPDSSRITRSAWGPELYRSTVTAAVLVEIYNFRRGAEPEFLGHGSGVLISEKGEIITNLHIVRGHRHVVIFFYPGTKRTYLDLEPGDIWFAEVVRIDDKRDLALLQLNFYKPVPRALPNAVRPLPLEDPERVEIGQDVFSIGHPEDLHWSYTEGVISQIRPRFEWEINGSQYKATVIQTQAAVSYGSSGGPLISRNGRMVGIIQSGFVNRPGFNFAISVHELRAFLFRP